MSSLVQGLHSKGEQKNTKSHDRCWWVWYLWIARDERQQHPKYHDELELHGSLHVFYDSPILKNGKWTLARQLGEEIPSYMFPELEECCRQKFIGMIGDLENKLPKVVELVNANNIKK